MVEDSAAVHVPVECVIDFFTCSGCGASFGLKSNGKRHMDMKRCGDGATLNVSQGVVVKMPDGYKRRRVSAHGKMPPLSVDVPQSTIQRIVNTNNNTTTNNNNNNNTTNNNTTNNNTTINNTTNNNTTNIHVHVTPDQLADVIRAGTQAESNLIQQIIMENGELRRMLRTVENAPAVLFRHTRGTRGPSHLRNVVKDGKHGVQEVRETGTVRTSVLKYCKEAAVDMVKELEKAVASVGPDHPPGVRDWARDVGAELRATKGNVTYARALELYRDANAKFYKLPHKDDVAGGVRGMETFIAPKPPPDNARAAVTG